MIRQFIFIGVGGSGAKTLRATKAEIERTFSLTEEGRNYLRQHGFPKVWQFISVDTPFFQDGQSFNAKMLSDREYVGLVNAGGSLDDLISLIDQKTNLHREVQEEVTAALPKKGEYPKPVDQGAGQYRAIGRTVVLAKLGHLASEIAQRINVMSNATAEEMPRLKKLFRDEGAGAQFAPQVVIVSGLSGGSGSGQFLDVSEVVKSVRKDDQWAYDQSAILYAPDIFTADQQIVHAHGLAPNSMSALGELINSKHRKQRSQSLQTVYKQLALSEANHAINNVGPKHLYLIGASNGGDSVFLNQNEAFQAVGSALAKWATDPRISEDISQYITNNIEEDSPPINSLGFSRVSLGMELFTKYAAGRLARYVTSKMLNKHKDFALDSERVPDSVIVERAAKDLFPDFIKAIPLRKSVIREMLHPTAETDEWKRELKSELMGQVNRGAQERPAEDWSRDIANNFKAIYPGSEEKWIRQRKTKDAINQIQEQFVQAVLIHVSRYGLKITIRLLEMLADEIRDNYNASTGGGLTAPSLANEIMSKVKSALSSISGVIKGDNNNIQDQFETIASQGRDNLIKFDDLEIVKIIMDAGRNLVAPIARELSDTESLLTKAKNDPDYKGRGVCKFLTWNDGNSAPEKPANNVKLLIPVEQYDELFTKLLCSSLNETQLTGALDRAAFEMIGGYKVIPELANINLNEMGVGQVIWSVFGTRDSDSAKGTDWDPASRTSWSYNLTEDLDFWEDIAEKYIRLPGRPFKTEISQSLYNWLEADGNALLRGERGEDLKSAFTAALESCKPFASPNESLHIAAHKTSPEIYPIFSKIPVDLSSTVSNLGQEMISAIKKSFPNINPNQLGDKTFVGEDPVNSIEIFTAFTKPMDHYVLTNLMVPIATSWNIHNSSLQSKDKFLKWRNARPLLETIPLRQRDIRGIVRGYYVSNLLNLVTETKDRTFVFNPKLSIFDVDRTKEFNEYKELPYPLVSRGTRIPKEDYLAAILSSVSVAYAECSNRGNLDPFRPYQILMEVGGREESGQELPQSDQLYDWIFQNEDYKAQSDAPKPDESVAGPVAGSPQERAAYCVRYFESELQTFKDTVLPGIKHKFVIWHAREEVIKALETLIKMTKDIAAR